MEKDNRGWMKQIQQNAPAQPKNNDDGRYKSFHWLLHRITSGHRQDLYNDLWVSKYYHGQIIAYIMLALTFIVIPATASIVIWLS